MTRRTRYWACPCCRVVMSRRKGEKGDRAALAMQIALSHELPQQRMADIGIVHGAVRVMSVLKASSFKAGRRVLESSWRGTREQLVRWAMAPVCEQCDMCSMKSVHVYPVQRKRACKHF